MVDPVTAAALIAAGAIGYAITQDGRVVPVTPLHLEESKPSFEKKIEIDTSEAHDEKLFPEAGSLIYVVNPATPTTAVFIRFNEPEAEPWELTKLRKIRFPFYRFWITNEAGEGTLEIRVARGLQVEPFEGKVDTVLNIDLNNLKDVSVPAPDDNDLLKYDAASEEWVDEPLLAAELPDHATRHEDGGADEISITGLAGNPADTVNKTGAQTIAGVKTFSSIPVLPAADPTLANQATRKAYVDAMITKEFFMPVTGGPDSADAFVPIRDGTHNGVLIDAAADRAFIEFYIPHDFSSITEAVVARIAGATATHRLNYTARYAAVGENLNTHIINLNDQDTAETDGLIYEQDISFVLAEVEAGDFVGLSVQGDIVNVPNDLILGVRFRYN